MMIISLDLPSNLKKAAEFSSESAGEYADCCSEFQQAQIEAIKRFVQAVKDEAQRLYDEDKSRIYEQEFRLAFGHIMLQLNVEKK